MNRLPRQTSTALPTERLSARRQLRRGSPVRRSLTEVHCLPKTVLKAATAADAVREGPYAGAWFAHRDHGGGRVCRGTRSGNIYGVML